MKVSRTFLNNYVGTSSLKSYPNLHGLFPPRVQEALVEDRSLRHVFLQVLPNRALGKLSVFNLPRGIDRELLDQHSVFFVGKDEVASELLKRKVKLVVGVVDKAAESLDDSIDCEINYANMKGKKYRVANGRTASFPLPDGSWLSVKGSGQFQYEERSPYFLASDEGLLRPHMGLVEGDEVQQLRSFSGSEGVGPLWFNQLLGYRAISAITDGAGGLVRADNLSCNGKKADPHLVFSRTAHPHRLNKLPQILRTDPGLANLSSRVSLGVQAIDPAQTKSLSPAELMLLMARNMGESEGFKSARGLLRYTIHSQDFNFCGQQAIDAFLPVEKGQEELNLDDVKSFVFSALLYVTAQTDRKRSENNFEVLFPDRLSYLSAFLKGYFAFIPDPMLEEYTYPQKRKVSYGVEDRYGSVRTEIFHPKALNSRRLMENNDERNREMLEMITDWAREELARRGTSLLNNT